MKLRKGLTLIEVVLSIAILGIISLSFLFSMSSHFNFLNKTQKITKDVFSAQEDMENVVEYVKKNIDDVDTTYYNDIDYDVSSLNNDIQIFSTLLSKNVPYRQVKVLKNNNFLYTYVPKLTVKSLVTLELQSIDNNIVHENYKVPYGYIDSNFQILSEFKNKNETGTTKDNKVYLNNLEWYISSKEFIMPTPKAILDDINSNVEEFNENTYYYPKWPRDYTLIKNDNVEGFGNPHSITIENIDEYAGRHILFTVTPGAKSGKLGITKISDPVFISGLPITNNLLMHFDAGFIGYIDDEQITTANGVKRWYDLSSISGEMKPKEYAFSNSNFPILNKTEIGLGFAGQYVNFNEGQSLTIEDQGTNGKEIFIYGVVRPKDLINESTVFLTNGSFKLNIFDNNKNIDEDWYLVKSAIISDNNSFSLGGSNIDIAEIAIYDADLDNDKIIQLETYFEKKYSSPIITGDIVSIDNISKTINKGISFKLPSTVIANMSRGDKKYVSVKWNGNFDINTPGVYEIIGNAILDKTKSFIYTLTIEEN